jgi:hypothetical protein
MTTPEEEEEALGTLNDLNKRFFELQPWAYLHTRLLGLVAAAGKPAAFAEMFKGDITIGGRLKVTGTGEPASPGYVEQFVAVDSEVLLHHAAETVLRAYLAFASGPDAPWLEIATHWSSKDFKAQVQRRFRGSGPTSRDLDETAVLFLGSQRPPDAETSHEDWRRATMNIEAFIREFANHWLEEAATYNALKHGLVASSREQSFRLAYDEAEPTPFEIEGMTLEVVEGKLRKEDRAIEWSMTTRWVAIERNLTLVWIATQLLKAAWAIAARSYGLPLPEGAQLWYPVDFTPDQLRPKGPIYSARLRRSLVIQLPNRGPGA